MTAEVRVGDVVAWLSVPSGALVRALLEKRYTGHVLRVDARGQWVHTSGEEWCEFGVSSAWLWDPPPITVDDPVTVVALNVPADATAEHLRELAEVFDVREAWLSLICALTTGRMTQAEAEWHNGGRDIDVFAPRLHAAGWRPGMTAEDAARLLAEANK